MDIFVGFGLAILALILLFLVFVLIKMFLIASALSIHERQVLDFFDQKINKIPALIESIRRYSDVPQAFEAVLSVYERAIMLETDDLYAILESNARLTEEIRFLLKFTTRIPDLQRDGDFLAFRNSLVLYEQSIERELRMIETLIARFNRLKNLKNWTVFGLFIPISERPAIA